MFKIIFILSVVSFANAANTGGGGFSLTQSSTTNSLICPDVTPDYDVISVSKLMGKWYIYEEYLIDDTQVRECTIGIYTLLDNDKFQFLYLKNKIYYGTTETLIGNATLVAPGMLMMKITSQPTKQRAITTILGTDFEKYIVFYTCDEGIPKITIVTKTTSPSEVTLNVVYSTIANNNLPVYAENRTNKERCTYLPLNELPVR